MSLKFSLLASARPPETTLAAVCRSGRSLFAWVCDTKRVWVGSATLTLAALTGALPPPAAASNEAVRTVATTFWSLAATTVMIALPA